MSTNSLGVAVIGAGMVGRAHAAGYRAAVQTYDLDLPQVRLVAVADAHEPFAVDAAQRFGFDRHETSWQAVVDAPDIDVVSVAIANELHRPVVEALLAAGKHVLCEKPFAATAAGAAQAIAAAQAAGLVVMENFMFLYHHQHRRVSELVLDGRIGELRSISADFAIPAGPHGPVSTVPEVAGYPIRTAELFLGSGGSDSGIGLLAELPGAGGALRVAGATRQERHGQVIGGTALLHTDGGVSAQLGYGISHSYRNRYAVWGSTGRLWLDRAYTPPDDHRPVIHLETAAGTQSIEVEPDAAFVNSLGAFAAAVRHGGSASAQLAADIRRHAELTDAIL